MSQPALNASRRPTCQPDSLFNDLEAFGWTVIDGFFPESLTNALRNSVGSLLDEGKFRPAGIGCGEVIEDQRCDHIAWLERNGKDPAMVEFMLRLDEIQTGLNRRFYLGLSEFEMHAALYSTGTFYKRHLDNRFNSNRRQVTFILYLNPDWQPGDGGELVLYDQETPQRIEPRNGRFVCFLSNDFPHEVMPTHRARMSLTGWYLQRR